VAAIDPAMVIVTVADSAPGGAERAGCLVGFHGQSSIDPPRYAVWLSKANHTFGVALRSSHLAVHLLGADDRAVAAAFGARTGDVVDKFADQPFEPGPGGVPLLTACPYRFVIERSVVLDDGGDHVCFTGPPVAAWPPAAPFTPLRLSQVDHLDPGHPADDFTEGA
jgi:flavin reductase (DIM6/NTAB) family NADH-FMN oxidoreductase RutF